jgi:interleukin-1 receptor-associated kinase 4
MELLLKIGHESICRLFAFSTDGPQRCLVMELCPGGSLDERLACRVREGHALSAPLPWQQRVQVAQEVAEALNYLHSLTPPAIHRDLKVSSACENGYTSGESD